MTYQRCPQCDQPIDADAINIQEGVALCAECGKLSRLSELNLGNRTIREILSEPPSGCSIESLENGVLVTASLRSSAGFLGAAAFALFWNGIVSIFVLLAIAGLYSNLVGPLPEWFPIPVDNQGRPEIDNGPMSLGMSLFLCLFLTPFVAIGLFMTVTAIVNLIGKIEVFIEEQEAWAATGIGIFKWKRRFDPQQVREIKFGTTRWNSEETPRQVLELVSNRTIKLGSSLPQARREWLKTILTELFQRGGQELRNLNLPRLTWVRANR